MYIYAAQSFRGLIILYIGLIIFVVKTSSRNSFTYAELQYTSALVIQFENANVIILLEIKIAY